MPELRNAVDLWRRQGISVALVPTMGALHAGHLSLVAAGKQAADRVVASIFVNPRQFGPQEDLARYPRREAEDAALLEAAGCDLLFLPGVEVMYPPGFATTVQVARVSEGLCGAARPGHFDGVATVVAKLLIQARADVALFGEKDYQQLMVVRRLAADLDIDTRILGCPTVRDADGLALSSRNAYLSGEERARAVRLPQALAAAAEALRSGEPTAAVLEAARQKLASAGFAPVDYFELRDADTLAPMERLDRPARLLAAAWLGTTRLIDNVAVAPAGS